MTMRDPILLPHPAYGLDLAPSDSICFDPFHFLSGRNFENSEAVKVDLTEFFASKLRDSYHREIINLAERCLKTIESDGLYFESNLISCQKTMQIKFCLKKTLLMRVSVNSIEAYSIHRHVQLP